MMLSAAALTENLIDAAVTYEKATGANAKSDARQFSLARRDIEKAITDMAELLEDCAAYFDKRSDVIDGDYGASEPNEEMTMLTRIQRCLA